MIMTAKERKEKRKEERDGRRRYRLSEYNAARDGGLECPECGCHHFDTVYTRHHAGSVRRRKQCRNCGKRILTRERIVDETPPEE